MKSYNIILIEKQQKDLLYYQENFINMSIFGEDILPSNQQQIIDETKFTYSPLGKAFDKQIKTIEDQGKKQIDALEKLKPKEETKPIEDEHNNQSRAATIFNELINKRKELMNKLYDNVDYNKLKFDSKGYIVHGF